MILRVDRTVQTAQGQAVAGALFYVLTQPANATALTPLANVYADTLGTPAANPVITDGLGQVALYLDNGQLYTFVVVSPQLVTQVYLDQNVGITAGAGISTFAQTPAGAINGVNTVFTLTVNPALLLLQYNQGTLVPGVGYTTSIVGGVYTVTLAVAPQVGDTLFASGIASPSSSSIFAQIPAGAINGVNTVFTLTVNPALLFLQNNQGTLVPNVGYTTVVSGGVLTITMAVAPQVGDSLFASGIL